MRVPQDGADPVERARAHFELGVALRRAGRPLDAREPLRAAVDPLPPMRRDRPRGGALAELRATGARPRRRLITGLGALTRSERRVAELAATGCQNCEIAAELVVTLATVEYHLRHAYRKLAITSRSELGVALGTKRDEARAKLRLNVRLLSGLVATLPAAPQSRPARSVATRAAHRRPLGAFASSPPTPRALLTRASELARPATAGRGGERARRPLSCWWRRACGGCSSCGSLRC